MTVAAGGKPRILNLQTLDHALLSRRSMPVLRALLFAGPLVLGLPLLAEAQMTLTVTAVSGRTAGTTLNLDTQPINAQECMDDVDITDGYHSLSHHGKNAKKLAQLKAKGSSMSALRTLVTAQISFNRLISSLYKVKVEVDPAEVDKKYNEIANDPRLQPVTVYEIMEIEMPVENTGEAMAEQLLVARAADAAQFRNNFKGCGSARQAASG